MKHLDSGEEKMQCKPRSAIFSLHLSKAGKLCAPQLCHLGNRADESIVWASAQDGGTMIQNTDLEGGAWTWNCSSPDEGF